MWECGRVRCRGFKKVSKRKTLAVGVRKADDEEPGGSCARVAGRSWLPRHKKSGTLRPSQTLFAQVEVTVTAKNDSASTSHNPGRWLRCSYQRRVMVSGLGGIGVDVTLSHEIKELLRRGAERTKRTGNERCASRGNSCSLEDFQRSTRSQPGQTLFAGSRSKRTHQEAAG